MSDLRSGERHEAQQVAKSSHDLRSGERRETQQVAKSSHDLRSGEPVVRSTLDPRECITAHALDRYRERIADLPYRAIIAAIWTDAVQTVCERTFGGGCRDRLDVRCGNCCVIVVSGVVATVLRGRTKSRRLKPADRWQRRADPVSERRPNAWKQRALRELASEGVL